MKRQMTPFENVIFSMIGKLGREIEDKEEQRLEADGGLETEVLTAEIELLSRIVIDLQFDMIANIYASNE